MLSARAAGPTELRLDDVTHQAFVGDRELVRLTTAFVDAGLIDTTFLTLEGRERGTRVHGYVHQQYLGNDVERVVRVEDRPFWDGYKAFQRETEFDTLQSEFGICDLEAGYAGRGDLFGQLPKVQSETFSPYYDLLDVKIGSVPHYVGLQTMGYRRLVRVDGKPVFRVRRWALHLPGDGTYRLVPLNMRAADPKWLVVRINRDIDTRDERIMLAAVTISNYKRGLFK